MLHSTSGMVVTPSQMGAEGGVGKAGKAGSAGKAGKAGSPGKGGSAAKGGKGGSAGKGGSSGSSGRGDEATAAGEAEDAPPSSRELGLLGCSSCTTVRGEPFSAWLEANVWPPKASKSIVRAQMSKRHRGFWVNIFNFSYCVLGIVYCVLRDRKTKKGKNRTASALS